MSGSECDDCGLDGDVYLCINGEVYGPCTVESCGGVCDPVRRCTCECHQ